MSSARGLAHEAIGNGHQQPGAVAAAPIGVHTAAMREPQQRGQGALHHFMRWGSAQPGHKADTTGVVVRCIALICHLTLLAGVAEESTTQNFDAADGFFGSTVAPSLSEGETPSRLPARCRRYDSARRAD